MALLVVPIINAAVRQSSSLFAWWPHPLFSTIHNYLTEKLLPLMIHCWLGAVKRSCNRSVLDGGCEAKEERATALCWNAGSHTLCMHVQSTCLNRICMFELVYSQTPLISHITVIAGGQRGQEKMCALSFGIQHKDTFTDMCSNH